MRTTGQTTTANGESATIPATSPYTVTVANAATFAANLGVLNASTGVALEKVASGSTPATGQYSVSAGTYTFAAADEGLSVSVSYTYTVAASGRVFTVSNALLGVQPVFKAALETLYTAPSGLKKAVLTLNACVSNKLSMATKHEDFAIPEMDFEAFADDAGNVFTWSFSEAG